jgi:hypothetical protein
MAGFALPLIMQGASLLGGLFGNKKQTQTQTQNQNSSYNNTNRPVYDDNILNLRNRLAAEYMSNLENGPADMNGEIINSLGNFNRAGDQSSRLMENILASRGIRGPAAGYALSMPRINQQMQSANYLNSVPQMMEQRRFNNLGQSSQFLQSLPYGQNQSGTSNSQSTGTQTTPSNTLSGGFQSLADMLAYQYGRGMFGGGQSGGGFQMPNVNLGGGNSAPIWNLPRPTYGYQG